MESRPKLRRKKTIEPLDWRELAQAPALRGLTEVLSSSQAGPLPVAATTVEPAVGDSPPIALGSASEDFPAPVATLSPMPSQGETPSVGGMPAQAPAEAGAPIGVRPTVGATPAVGKPTAQAHVPTEPLVGTPSEGVTPTESHTPSVGITPTVGGMPAQAPAVGKSTAQAHVPTERLVGTASEGGMPAQAPAEAGAPIGVLPTVGATPAVGKPTAQAHVPTEPLVGTPSEGVTPMASHTPTVGITPSVGGMAAQALTEACAPIGVRPTVGATPAMGKPPAQAHVPTEPLVGTPSAGATPTVDQTPSVGATPTLEPSISATPAAGVTPMANGAPAIVPDPRESALPQPDQPSVVATPSVSQRLPRAQGSPWWVDARGVRYEARRVARVLIAQHSMSMGEERVYDTLWRARESDGVFAGNPRSKTFSLGYDRIARLVRLNEKSVRLLLPKLIAKKILEVVAAEHSANRTGRTYRIFSQEEILDRQRAAGLTSIVKNGRAVEFVWPADEPVAG